MDSNFEALFTHFSPTNDQVKALLLDLWKKNDEKQKKIDKMMGRIADLKKELLDTKLEIPSCSCCLEKFDEEDHQPYVLSCPHIVCSRCLHPALQPHVGKNKATSSERLNNAHIIDDQYHPSKICPACEEPVTTTLKKVCL